jgi:spartin
MSKATENVAKGVLYGIVKTAGFFSAAVITSSVGKKFFRLMPGEVALVSLDAFAKLFDALEKATTDVLQSTSVMTQNVVAHRLSSQHCHDLSYFLFCSLLFNQTC